MRELQLVSRVRLRAIDNQIAESGIIDALNQQSEDIKEASLELKVAANSLEKIVGVVDDVVKILDGFIGLQFV